MTIIEFADEICRLASDYKVDIDISVDVDADKSVNVSVAPTYRDRPQTDFGWK